MLIALPFHYESEPLLVKVEGPPTHGKLVLAHTNHTSISRSLGITLVKSQNLDNAQNLDEGKNLDTGKNWIRPIPG